MRLLAPFRCIRLLGSLLVTLVFVWGGGGPGVLPDVALANLNAHTSLPLSCNRYVCVATSRDGISLHMTPVGIPTSLLLLNGAGITKLAFDMGSGFTLTDIETGQSHVLKFPRSKVSLNRLEQEGAIAAGLAVSATTEVQPDRLRLAAVVNKTGTTDRLVRLCYNLLFDATSWWWHDSIHQ